VFVTKRVFYVLSLFFIGIFGFAPALAQSGSTDSNVAFYQPTPQIIAPAPNSVLRGVTVLKIAIESTAIQKIEVYATQYFIGQAQHLDQTSTNWYLSWDTSNYPDGQYGLIAWATIYQGGGQGNVITTISQAVPVTLQNSQSSSGAQPSGVTSNTSGTTSTTSSKTNQADTSPSSSSSTPSASSSTNAWKTVASITFPKQTANQLEKIEYKLDENNKEYLVFSGHADPLSLVTLTITSQPIVLSIRTNSSGDW
jgi:hypothetical protein